MIRFDRVSITYEGHQRPSLIDVDLAIPEGELAVVIGPTGVGKSTLLGAINGLVPHFTGGLLQGRVTVDGRDTATTRPRQMSDLVGVVGQDPQAGFVSDRVERELAFGMEQLGVAPEVMRTRVEETLDLLGLAGLRDRPLDTLSGGEQQRVAIGSVLVTHPKVLVLDEPTSALDPTAAEDVMAVIARLVHDLGVTAVVAEHRLERIVQLADQIIEVRADGTVRHGGPAQIMIDAAVAPPIVALGRWAGWDPLPLRVRDARRAARDLRERAGTRPADPYPVTGDEILTAKAVTVDHGRVRAVNGVDLSLASGQVVALMGRNGAGKSSLLWALQGSGPRTAGQVQVDGADPASLNAGDARKAVGLVPQTAADLLYRSTVGEECAQADTDAGAPPGTCAALLDRIVDGTDPGAHPRDLSEGQRLAVVLAIQMTANPRVILLDEPTRGLDYQAKDALSRLLRALAADGRAVLVSTHDVEFVAGCCDRVIVMAQGEIVADGPTAEVVVASPMFAPQVTKIMAPLPVLTVDQVIEVTV